MTVIFPEAVRSQGKKKVTILTTEPATPAAPTTTELTAGIEATMFFIGQYAPTGSQEKGAGPRRTGQNSVREVLGNKTFTAPTLQYVHDPQGDPTDEANLVKAALAEGTEVWIYSRAGVDSETAFVADDKVRLDHLEAGYQWTVPSGDDAFAVEIVTQETGYVTDPLEAVVASGV